MAVGIVTAALGEYVEVDQPVERSGVDMSGGGSWTTGAGICRFP
jgi:hypothetical protein